MSLKKNARHFLFAMIVMVLFGLTLPILSSARTARGASPGPTQQQSNPRAANVPPFHDHLPCGPLPRVLPWWKFVGNPWAENTYRLAARIRPVLDQQPCYCWCGRTLGHTCLLDCFTRPDKHAAACETCIKEAIFAYQQTQKGLTAQAIRAEIIRGEWRNIDLSKYDKPPAP